MRKAGGGDILVLAGGVIPDEDIPLLKEMGVREVFVSGSSTDDVIDLIEAEVHAKHAAA